MQKTTAEFLEEFGFGIPVILFAVSFVLWMLSPLWGDLVWVAIFIAVWTAAGFGIAKENERIVKSLLGTPYGVAGSGLFWIPFGIARVLRYPSSWQELTHATRDENGKVKKDERGRPVPVGGFITAPGRYEYKKQEGETKAEWRELGPVNVGITSSTRFQWPSERDKLFACVRYLPPPDRPDLLTDMFEELVLDAQRAQASHMTYLHVLSERKKLADNVRQEILGGPSSKMFEETGLAPTLSVVIQHVDLPEDAQKAIDDEEAARLKAQAVIRTAEGTKQSLILEGQGRAGAIKAIKETGREGLEIQALHTMEQMAKGTSNTIFFPIEGVQRLMSNFLTGGRWSRGQRNNQPRGQQQGQGNQDQQRKPQP